VQFGSTDITGLAAAPRGRARVCPSVPGTADLSRPERESSNDPVGETSRPEALAVARLSSVPFAARARQHPGLAVSGAQQQMLASPGRSFRDPRDGFSTEPSQGLAPLSWRELAESSGSYREGRHDDPAGRIMNMKLAEAVADELHIMVHRASCSTASTAGPSPFRSKRHLGALSHGCGSFAGSETTRSGAHGLWIHEDAPLGVARSQHYKTAGRLPDLVRPLALKERDRGLGRRGSAALHQRTPNDRCAVSSSAGHAVHSVPSRSV